MIEPTITIEGLSRHYDIGGRTVQALDGVGVTVHRGEFVAVVGVSGSGKSTLLHLIGGLDRPTDGQLWVDDVELGSAEEEALIHHRRQRVGFVFQTFNLLPRLTALENVALPLMFSGVPRQQREAKALALLEEVGLGERLDHYPSQLSGGEQQRVAIARALVQDPAVILADEPTGNLDSKRGAEILDVLHRLSRERDVTVLLVTHDPAAAAVADRAIHLRDGRVNHAEAEVPTAQQVPEAQALEPQAQAAGADGETTFPSPAESNRQGVQTSSNPPKVSADNPKASADNHTHDDNGTPRNGSLRWDDLFRHALSSLGRRMVRSGLTVFGVFVGIITIVAMLSVAVGVEREMRRNIEAMGLESVYVTPPQAEGDDFDPFADSRPAEPITPDSVETLRQQPDVASVAPLVDLPAYLNLQVKWGDETVPARVQNSMERLNPFMRSQAEVVAGQALAPGEAQGIVLSDDLARALGADDVASLMGQTVTLVVELPRGEVGEFPGTVVGVKEWRRNVVELGAENAATIKRWWYGQPDLLETRGYDGLVVKAKSITAVPAVEDQVQAMGFVARSLRDFLDLAGRVFAILNALLGSVGGLALFVAALGVTNTMIMAVYERTREIGIMKAIGAARGDVLRLFIVEAALMGFLGGLLGLVLGALLGSGVDWAAHQYLAAEGVRGIGPLSVVPWWLALGAIAFGTLIGLAAGAYPASRAARLDPVESLRH